MACGISCHKFPKTTPKSAWWLAGLLLTGLGACSAVPTPPSGTAPVTAARLAEPSNREASGLAASRRSPDLLWTHNDSGGEPVLFALDATTGALRGKVRLAGVTNTDWEDVAAFELDGRAWLLVADTGDNLAGRPGVGVHVIEEPDPATLDPARELPVLPAYSIPFIYEDGPRDCEAVAVDPSGRAVWLLTKRDVPARLYRLPLRGASREQPAAARLMGRLPQLRRPDALQRLVQAPLGAMIGMPTAMDFAPDGTAAAVLLYGELLLFPRRPEETWAEALAGKPVRLAPHGFPQAEAVAFSTDGRHLFVCSEIDDRLLRYDRP